MNLGMLLENNIAILQGQYKGEDDDRSESRRLLSFGKREDGLIPAIDLDTLSPKDIATLTKEAYLEEAWQEPTADGKWHKLIKIINANEGAGRGDAIFFKRGDETEPRREKMVDAQGDTYISDNVREVNKGSYRTYDADKLKGEGYIVFGGEEPIERFRNVLKKLNQYDDELTFGDLSDSYLSKASVSDEVEDIESSDIVTDPIDPSIGIHVDEPPVDADVDEVEEPEPEVEVDVKIEPDDVEHPKVDSEIEELPPEPEAKIEPEVEEPKLTRDIEDRLSELEDEIDEIKPKPEPKPELELAEPKPESELEPEPESELEPEPESELEPEPESEEDSELRNDISSALANARL